MENIRPISFINEAGQPDGLYINLIEEIARLNDWDLSYQRNSWPVGMQKVRDGEIDLMPALVKTQERDEFLDFHALPVMVSWGLVVTNSNANITAVTDLVGKNIAIMKGGQNGENFKTLVKKFNIDCHIVETATHADILPLLESGIVDAGVFFNTYNFGSHDIKTTSIIFNPVQSYFATAEGTNNEVLETIDRQLERWQRHKDSFYYQMLQKHLSAGVIDKQAFPHWILYAAGGLLALSALWIVSLRVLVQKRTLELQTSKERFYQTMKNSPVATALSAPDGTILFLNNRFINYFGYTVENIPTIEDWFSLAYPDKAVKEQLKSRWRKNLETYFQTGIFEPLEASVTCKDGNSKIIYFDFEAIADIHITTFVDRTELRNAERALKESERDYRTVADYTFDWEFWILPDFSMKYVSPACERITGYKATDFINDKDLLHKLIADEDKLLWKKHNDDLGEKCELLEHRIVTKDGSTRWIAHSCQSVYSENGEYLGKRVCNRDITEFKQVHEHLLQTQKMEAIGTLAGGVAHDFNNILSAVLGYTELTLRNPDCDEKSRKNLAHVLTAAERAKELVKQILMFSRKGEENRKPVKLNLVVAEAATLLRKTIPSTIAITQQINTNTGTVLADATQIHQIVMNLCTNAYHSMPDQKGEITISLSPVEIDKVTAAKYQNLRQGKYAQLIVSDTGEGMSPEVMSKIFNPFFTTKKQGEGTGLGLAVVHGIIQNHDGAIDVKSKVGEGTTFTAFFPLFSGTEKIKEQADDTSANAQGTEQILWVDDELMLAELGKETLESIGYRVTATSSATEALNNFRAAPNTYDLIITDQTMPEMAGDAFAQKALQIRENIPIIICTGHSGILDNAKAHAIGVKALLMKPFASHVLIKEVRRVLDEAV